MRLKHIMPLAVLFAAGGIIYSVHSQITPKPFPSFLVTEVMSSPVKDSPYLRTWTSARAVREDGSWAKISMGTPPIQNERDIYDFKSGVHTIVDDTTKSVVRESIPVDTCKSCSSDNHQTLVQLTVDCAHACLVSLLNSGDVDVPGVASTFYQSDLGSFGNER
jgi:hypothetical protein